MFSSGPWQEVVGGKDLLDNSSLWVYFGSVKFMKSLEWHEDIRSVVSIFWKVVVIEGLAENCSGWDTDS
jgi:hypothetical protein